MLQVVKFQNVNSLADEQIDVNRVEAAAQGLVLVACYVDRQKQSAI